MEIGLLGAFLGGVLTLLSPCSVMLLPAFFSYAFAGPAALIARTGVFYLGLVTTLVPLGMLAGSLGVFVNQHRTAFVTVSAVVVIVLGLIMLLGIPIPALSRSRGASGTSSAAVYALGTVYGLAGVCAGPLLGAVLTYAALGGSAVLGGIILFVFAAGMALPLLMLALAWGRLPFIRRWVRPREVILGRWRNTWTAIVGGALTSAVGALLLITDGTAALGGVLGASNQFRLESWALRATAGIPDGVVVLVAAAVLTAVWFTRRRQRSHGPGASGRDADERASQGRQMSDAD
ncbi:cytochrome c biogenesis protein CcdA [Deinobacterium chartae]|uniref:Cytochrome c biogenesis protein CcdA n=1 Tax=Deinobacterium chartae TaxID=521158 RepID=A0A841I704_9DEIO|nr:cytochrome c biogenesis CcdA family protein [Deinobacterium chartae]MBB6099662.1 cytochrome c biogenesis protein CcdA [Deinobacterium chartae]